MEVNLICICLSIIFPFESSDECAIFFVLLSFLKKKSLNEFIALHYLLTIKFIYSRVDCIDKIGSKDKAGDVEGKEWTAGKNV